MSSRLAAALAVLGTGCSLILDFDPLAAAPDASASAEDASALEPADDVDGPPPPPNDVRPAADAVLPSACDRAGGTVEDTTGDCFVALHDRLRTYADAHAACVELGGELASLRSADEQASAGWRMRAPNYYWIGLSDGVAEGTFTWADGAPLEFTAWNTGEPNDGAGVEDCALVEFGFTDGPPTWNDTPCSAEVYTLCRIPAPPAARWFR